MDDLSDFECSPGIDLAIASDAEGAHEAQDAGQHGQLQEAGADLDDVLSDVGDGGYLDVLSDDGLDGPAPASSPQFTKRVPTTVFQTRGDALGLPRGSQFKEQRRRLRRRLGKATAKSEGETKRLRKDLRVTTKALPHPFTSSSHYAFTSFSWCSLASRTHLFCTSPTLTTVASNEHPLKSDLAKAWDKGKLRSGDRLLVEMPGEKIRRCRVLGKGLTLAARRHANAWTLDGTIETAFSQIGFMQGRTDKHPFLGPTKRLLDAIAAVSLSYSQHMNDAVRALRHGICSGAFSCKFLILSDAHDSTPVKVRFASLRKDLACFARYWHNEGDKKDVRWRCLSADDFVRVARKSLPPIGIVEMLAHIQDVSWPSHKGDFVVVESHRLRMRPCFLERSNGSTIYNALARNHTHISIAELRQMAEHVPLVFWQVSSDLASSCQRAKMEKWRQVEPHNRAALLPESCSGVIMLIDGQCIGHIVHREIEKESEADLLIPRLYNAAWCCSLPGMFKELVKAFEKMAAEDMEQGFFPHAHPPNDEWAVHRRALASLTLNRALLTQANHEDTTLSDKHQQLLQSWHAFFNGDPRSPYACHFCFEQGCCGGQKKKVAVQRCAFLWTEVLLAGLTTKLPSKVRWYTFSPHLARQALGIFSNRALTRAQELSHQAWKTHSHSAPHAFHVFVTLLRCACEHSSIASPATSLCMPGCACHR